MPFLQPAITYTGNGTPLFVPLEGDGSVVIPGNVTIGGQTGADGLLKVINFGDDGVGIRSISGTGVVQIAPITNGASVNGGLVMAQDGEVASKSLFRVTRPGGDVVTDAVITVQNGNGGFGLALRADAAQVAGGGTIERVSGGTPSNTPDITLTSTGDVTIANELTVQGAAGVEAKAFNLSGAPAAGNYGKATITGAGNLVVANTGITANSIIMVTPQSASAVAEPLRVTVTPGTSFTIFNDNAGSVTAMYAVLSLDGAA